MSFRNYFFVVSPNNHTPQPRWYMLIYYTLVVLTLIAMMLYGYDNGKIKFYYMSIIVVFFVFFVGLRWKSDADYLPYLEMYSELPTLSGLSIDVISDLYGEPGYLSFTSLLKTLGFKFYLVSFFFAVSSILIKTYVSLKLSLQPYLTLCMYFCLHFITIEFIQIRWAVATSLLLLGLYFQYKRKLWKTVLLFLIASVFHYFSAIFFIVVLLIEIRSFRLFSALLLLMACGGILLQSSSFEAIAQSDSSLYAVQRMVRYLSEDISNLGIYSYLKLGMYLVLCYILRLVNPQCVKEGNRRNRFLLKASFSSISLTLFCSFIPVLHHRATVVADFLSIILIINMLDSIKKTGIARIICYTLTGLLLAWYVMDVFISTRSGVITEYRSWLTVV